MPPNSTFRRKAIRLPLKAHESRYAASFTIVTHERAPVFAAGGWAAVCIDILRMAANASDVRVFAYCVMPDHLHLLAQSCGGASLIDFIGEFKQRTAYRHKRATGRLLWQKSFRDRFLRREDDLLTAARYVFANPVREGLVTRPEDYPHSGSLVWERGVLVEA